MEIGLRTPKNDRENTKEMYMIFDIITSASFPWFLNNCALPLTAPSEAIFAVYLSFD
jgi:hypothetical protein